MSIHPNEKGDGTTPSSPYEDYDDHYTDPGDMEDW